MKVAVTLESKGLFKRLASAIEKEARVLTTVIAKQQVKSLKLRTRWTAGADDQPMPSLDPLYGKYKKGRKIRNLRQSGQMFRDLKSVAAAKVEGGWIASVEFASPRSALVARYNQNRARWFAFSPNDLAVIRRLFAGFGDRLAARLREA